MTAHIDRAPGQDPHVNYEPSGAGGLHEATPAGEPYEPRVEGRLQRTRIARTNDYAQAGARYRSIERWERDDLVKNLIDQLRQCGRPIQEKMVWHFAQCDAEFGERLADGLAIAAPQAAREPVGSAT
jgi:catalase